MVGDYMKQVNLFFDDDKYERVVAAKNKANMTWVEFVMQLAEKED